MKSKLASCLLVSLMAMAVLAFKARAADEGEDVASRRGNPSPSQSESNVNDYTFQDEQINLGPDDQDVLVLRTDQKNLVNRFVTATFPLNNVNPREVRNVFRELTGKEGGRAEVIVDKNTKNYWLQVICPQWQIPYLEECVKMLDEGWIGDINDGSDTLYYKAKWRNVADVDRIATRWGGEGFSTIDTRNNAVVRVDESYRIGAYQTGAALADVPEHQGLFKIKVYEVQVNNDTKLGLDYIAWKNGPGRNLFDVILAGYDAIEHPEKSTAAYTPWDPRTLTPNRRERYHWLSNLEYTSANYLLPAAYLDFLASKGKAKVMAQGEVMVKSGSFGAFGSTDQVVTFDAQPNDPGTDGTSPTRLTDIDSNYNTGDISVSDRALRRHVTGEVGLLIDIEPVILRETMEVNIFAYLSSVTGYTPQGLPIIEANMTETVARMADGSTLILAGLTRSEKINSTNKIPLLGSIPGLGWLFGGETNANRRKELVVVIEATTEKTDSETSLANAPEIATVAAMVEGSGVQEPENAFGFDQWLLGANSGGKL